MSLLDDASIVVTPNGYKAGELFAVIPVPTEGAEILSQPVDLVTDFLVNSGGVIVDADTFTTSGGSLDGIKKQSFLTVDTRYKLTIEGDTTSSGFTIGSLGGSGNEYGSGFGTFYFTALHSGVWIRQGTAGTTNITSFTIKEYTSADLDVTRETAATRVDENGLVNYAEVLGDSVLTGNNSNFDTGIGSWITYNGATLVHSTDKLEVTLTSGQSGARINTNSLISGGQSGKTFKVRARIWQGTTTTTAFKIFIGVQENITISSTPTYFEFELTPTSTSMLTIYRAVSGDTGTYFIDDVTVKEVTRDNVPRIDYTGGGCPHILAEPMRTNNLTASQDLTVSFWNSVSTETIVASTVLSPDGTTFGFKAIPTASSGNTTHYVDYDYGFLSMPIGELTYSVFAKPFGYTNFQLASSSGMNVRYQNFELTGDGVIGTGDVNSAKIEKIGDWYRCSITETSTSTSPRVLNLGLPSSGLGRNPSFVGNSTDGVLLWGGQIEEGAYGTSYIPNLSTTSGSTVTRNQDIFSRDGIGSLIGTEGVLFVESAIDAIGVQRSLCLSDGSSNNRILLYYDNGGTITMQLKTGGNTYSKDDNTGAVATDFNKIAIRYQDNRIDLSVNGATLRTVSGVFSIPTVLSQLNFGAYSSAINPFFGKVKQLQVYKTALTDTQLAALTS